MLVFYGTSSFYDMVKLKEKNWAGGYWPEVTNYLDGVERSMGAHKDLHLCTIPCQHTGSLLENGTMKSDLSYQGHTPSQLQTNC